MHSKSISLFSSYCVSFDIPIKMKSTIEKFNEIIMLVFVYVTQIDRFLPENTIVRKEHITICRDLKETSRFKVLLFQSMNLLCLNFDNIRHFFQFFNVHKIGHFTSNMRKRKHDFVPNLKKTSVVKCALRKRIKEGEQGQLIYDEIQNDVTEMSALAVEASRYAHFCLMRNFDKGIFPTGPIRFKNFFDALCFSSATRYAVNPDREYFAIRPNNLPWYPIYSQRSNIVVYLSNQLATSFKNNLKEHAWTRLRRFLKTFRLNGEPFTALEITNTLKYLLNVPTDEHPEAVPNEFLLQGLREYGLKSEKMLDIGSHKDYYKHVELFYKIQKFNDENRLKNFKLIPQFHFGAVHVQYDQQGMFEMLKRLKLIKRGENESNVIQFRNGISQSAERRRKMWLDFFKPPEKGRKIFDYVMFTDGVAASFVMRSEKLVFNDKDQREMDLQRIRHKLLNREYDASIGLDPGAKLMVGGVINSKTSRNVTDVTPIKISSKEFHNRSGFNTRKALLHNWTTKEPQVSSTSMDFRAYAKNQLSIFGKKQREFSERKVVRLKLKKYICTHKLCVELAKEIIGDHKNVFIAIGSSEMAANSPIRGYRRVPHRQLIRELRRRADVLMVDEYRTTKLCANCRHVNIISRSPHRYLFCPNCHTHWHRDVGAGVNILYKATCEVLGVAHHPNFNRSTPADQL